MMKVSNSRKKWLLKMSLYKITFRSHYFTSFQFSVVFPDFFYHNFYNGFIGEFK